MDTEATVERRSLQLAETIELLLATGAETAYIALREKREEILATRSSPQAANVFILRACALAPGVDWNMWLGALAQTNKPSVEEAEAASLLLPHLFTAWPSLDENQAEDFPDVVESVVSRVGPTDGDAIHPVVEASKSVLDPADWATGADTRERRQYLHEGGRNLRAMGTPTWQQVEALLTNDLVAGLEYAQAHQAGVGAASVFEAIRGIETMGEPLGLGPIARLITLIPEFDAAVEPDEASAELSARACLTASAREQDGNWTKPPFGVSASKIRAVAQTKGRGLENAIAHWLALHPRVTHVAPVAELLLPDLPSDIEKALAQWAADCTRPQRTSLAKSLLRTNKDASNWLHALSREPLNETGLVEILRERLVAGDSVAVRAMAAREARALRLRTQGAGRGLAGAVGQLLKKTGRARGDIGVAAILIAAVPRGHVNRDSWAKSLKNRCKERDYRFTDEEIQALQAAGVSLPKDGVRKSLWERIFGR